MSGETEQIDKQFRTIKIIALAMLVGAPAVFLLAAQAIAVKGVQAKAGNELLLYMLLVVSMVQPAVAAIIERYQIDAFRKSQQKGMKPINLFFTISFIKIAMVEAVYIYGLVVFMMTGEFTNMLYFYPIGIVWSFIHWPRREKYNQLLEKLNRP